MLSNFSFGAYRRSFYNFALTTTAIVATTGGVTQLASTEHEMKATATQQSFNKKYVLKYADGVKALFKTEDGLSLVMVGSTIPAAGDVVKIEKKNGHWAVKTSRNLTFVQN
jgi:hypothetical protein